MEPPRKIVLDTSILIDELRRTHRNSLLESLEESSELAVTMISAFELYYGACKTKEIARNLTSARGLLSTLQVLNLTDKSCEKAAQILADLESSGKPIDSKDLFIGTIAETEGYAVLTKNPSHFERIPGLQVIGPRELQF